MNERRACSRIEKKNRTMASRYSGPTQWRPNRKDRSDGSIAERENQLRAGFLLSFTSSSLSFTGFFRVLPSFPGFYIVLPGFTGFNLVLLGFT